MMNGGMPASGGGGHLGQMGGQMGMNPMVMGRMPMGPDQVGAFKCLKSPFLQNSI